MSILLPYNQEPYCGSYGGHEPHHDCGSAAGAGFGSCILCETGIIIHCVLQMARVFLRMTQICDFAPQLADNPSPMPKTRNEAHGARERPYAAVRNRRAGIVSTAIRPPAC